MDRDQNTRVELWMPNELAARLDQARGPVARSEFIRNAIERALDDGLTGRLGAATGEEAA